MAKIQTETVVITFNKLVKDTADQEVIVNDDIILALSSVAEELIGAGVIVEVDKA